MTHCMSSNVVQGYLSTPGEQGDFLLVYGNFLIIYDASLLLSEDSFCIN